MAKIKIKFRVSSSSKKEGMLVYQVIQNRVSQLIITGYQLFPNEWDQTKMSINYSSVGDMDRYNYLLLIKEKVRLDIERLEKIIQLLDSKRSAYTSEDVVNRYLCVGEQNFFFAFANELVMRLTTIGKKSTAINYASAIRSFARYCKNKDLYFEEFNSDLMISYESYLFDHNICPNTTSYYMRNLRAIYNRAVEKGYVTQSYPFKHVYTGVDKTVKRAVPLEVIRKISKLDLADKPNLDFARDMFMFSFYTRGMSFVDVAFLKKINLKNGFLSYRRRKTGQLLIVKWEKPMQDLIEKYFRKESSYLFPIIKNEERDPLVQYKYEEHKVNIGLKKIGKSLNLAMPLTTYVARHSWASIARRNDISISTICEALGHTSEAVTRIYLASLDTSLVDNANDTILSLL